MAGAVAAPAEGEAFASPDAALAWAMEQGAFETVEFARQAYLTLRARERPSSAAEMARFWVADVRDRLEEAQQDSAGVPSLRTLPAEEA